MTREEAPVQDGRGVSRVERHGAVEVFTLDRPEALNALDPTLVTELNAYFNALHDRPEVRVVVLRGEGRAFCAGLDLKRWELAQTDAIAGSLQIQKRIAGIVRRMRSCPQPIVGLGQGAACGGGFALLLACDLRIAAPSLRMNAAPLQIGLGGADIGSSYLLPRLVGHSLASELLLTGRFLAAERALSLGLVSQLVDEAELLKAGLQAAGEMTRAAPLALRLTKDALNLNIDAPSLEAAMAIEDRQQVILTATRDHEEADSAFLAKRAPEYQDR